MYRIVVPVVSSTTTKGLALSVLLLYGIFIFYVCGSFVTTDIVYQVPGSSQ